MVWAAILLLPFSRCMIDDWMCIHSACAEQVLHHYYVLLTPSAHHHDFFTFVVFILHLAHHHQLRSYQRSPIVHVLALVPVQHSAVITSSLGGVPSIVMSIMSVCLSVRPFT